MCRPMNACVWPRTQNMSQFVQGCRQDFLGGEIFRWYQLHLHLFDLPNETNSWYVESKGLFQAFF